MLPTAESRGDGSRLATAASTIRLIARRLGWASALLWSCAALGRRLSVHIFVVKKHPIDIERNAPNTGALEARLLTRDEVLHYFDRSQGYGYLRAFASGALSRGDRCFGILEDGHLLWYCWYAQGPAPVFEDMDAVVDFPFLYAYNAHTDRAHRGRGLHQTGVHSSGRVFAREGYRGLLAYIDVHNVEPLLAAESMGESVVGYVVIYRLRGRVRWYATPGCRQGGLRIHRRANPSSVEGLSATS